MKSLITSFTGISLIVFGILVALQWFPPTGIVLMMFMGPIWIGFMPYVVVLALILDILSRGLPRALLILPVAPFIAYYAMFVLEMVKVADIEEALSSQNPSEILRYDPNFHSLITTSNLTYRYYVPAVYSPFGRTQFSDAESFSSRRIATMDVCAHATNAGVSSSRIPLRMPVEQAESTRSISQYKNYPNLCILRMVETPSKLPLQVQETVTNDLDPHLETTIYEFFLDENHLGSFTDATYDKLPIVPRFIIGCLLISSSPAWGCQATIWRTRTRLQTLPNGGGTTESDAAIIASLLEIEKYTEYGLDRFQNNQETLDALKAQIAKKENEESVGLGN